MDIPDAILRAKAVITVGQEIGFRVLLGAKAVITVGHEIGFRVLLGKLLVSLK